MRRKVARYYLLVVHRVLKVQTYVNLELAIQCLSSSSKDGTSEVSPKLSGQYPPPFPSCTSTLEEA